MDDYQRSFAGKVVLITGGAGSIGSNLVGAVADLDARLVIALDDLSAGHRWKVPSRPNVLFVEGGVTDDVALKRVFNERPEVVFHLAAFFANQNSVDYPERDLMVNGMGTLRLLEYARLCAVERVIYASSGCSIYGAQAPLPLTEDFMSMRLSSPYQITKMLGELYANFFGDHYDLAVVKARFFNSYGPGEVPGQYRNVIPNFVYRALNGEPLPFTGADDASRDFTFVGDIVDALLRAAYFDAAIGQEMNIASGAETRILDLAERINELTGNRAGIIRATHRRWDTKVRLVASVDRARSLLGYAPKTDLEGGLQQTIAWFRDNWDQIRRDADFPPGASSAVRDLKA